MNTIIKYLLNLESYFGSESIYRKYIRGWIIVAHALDAWVEVITEDDESRLQFTKDVLDCFLNFFTS